MGRPITGYGIKIETNPGDFEWLTKTGTTTQKQKALRFESHAEALDERNSLAKTNLRVSLKVERLTKVKRIPKQPKAEQPAKEEVVVPTIEEPDVIASPQEEPMEELETTSEELIEEKATSSDSSEDQSSPEAVPASVADKDPFKTEDFWRTSN